MTIDEAITHASEVAKQKYTEGMLCHANPDDDLLDGCIDCAKEHEQLAEWLEELKVLREQKEQGKYKIYDVEAEMYKANENFHNTMVFRLNWTENLGFGELNFYYDTEKNEWECDSECMSKELCSAVLNKWLEDVMSKEK